MNFICISVSIKRTFKFPSSVGGNTRFCREKRRNRKEKKTKNGAESLALLILHFSFFLIRTDEYPLRLLASDLNGGYV
jgi:hypothetical protein